MYKLPVRKAQVAVPPMKKAPTIPPVDIADLNALTDHSDFYLGEDEYLSTLEAPFNKEEPIDDDRESSDYQTVMDSGEDIDNEIARLTEKLSEAEAKANDAEIWADKAQKRAEQAVGTSLENKTQKTLDYWVKMVVNAESAVMKAKKSLDRFQRRNASKMSIVAKYIVRKIG